MSTSTSTTTPTAEVKAILKEFCKINKEKYGDNWKEILAKEMAEKTMREFPAYLAKQLGEKK